MATSLNRPTRPNEKLTERQRLFCEEYIAQGPLTSPVKAAEKAGYSSPHTVAYQIMRKPLVVAYLEKRNAEARLRTNIQVDDLIEELAKIVFFDPRSLYIKENGRHRM